MLELIFQDIISYLIAIGKNLKYNFIELKRRKIS